jgi:predicted membrane protein
MYEIKKIFPSSLAKYCSVIMAITILILGSVNLILNLVGVGIQYNIPWDQQLTSLLASVIFFAIFFYIIGYIFALVYNSVTSKTKGVMIEFKLADKKLLEEIEKKEEKEIKDVSQDKFVV